MSNINNKNNECVSSVREEETASWENAKQEDSSASDLALDGKLMKLQMVAELYFFSETVGDCCPPTLDNRSVLLLLFFLIWTVQIQQLCLTFSTVISEMSRYLPSINSRF